MNMPLYRVGLYDPLIETKSPAFLAGCFPADRLEMLQEAAARFRDESEERGDVLHCMAVFPVSPDDWHTIVFAADEFPTAGNLCRYFLQVAEQMGRRVKGGAA